MGTQALPSLKEGHLPFIVVNLRIKKENTDVRTDKTVIRLGSDLEFQVTKYGGCLSWTKMGLPLLIMWGS